MHEWGDDWPHWNELYEAEKWISCYVYKYSRCRLISKENMAHAYRAGIRSNGFGSSSNNAKLTDEEVILIKENLGIISNSDIALMFGVSKSTISKIKTGVNWRRHND